MRPLLPLLPAGQQSIHGATHYPCVSRCWAPGSLVDERYPMFHQRKYPLITIPYPHQCRWFSPEVKSVLIETVWDSLRMFKGKLRGLANWPQSLGWFWWHCSDIFWLFFSLEKKTLKPTSSMSSFIFSCKRSWCTLLSGALSKVVPLFRVILSHRQTQQLFWWLYRNYS